MNATQILVPLHADRAEIVGIKDRWLPLIASKINATTSCWLWTASVKENGYAQYNANGKNWNAHRLVYLLSGRDIPAGLELDHLCRVRHCVNPEHLEPVTRAENVRRQAAYITICPQGHVYTAENTYVYNGGRHCRACRATQSAAQSARRKAARAEARLLAPFATCQ